VAHGHSHHHDDTDSIKVAFALNLTFTLLEIVGGLAINSVAVLSDALHDLGDSVSLGLAWFLDGYAKKESDRKYSYGYRRFSLLGALFNAIILIGGSLFVLSEAIPRLSDPQEFDAPGMILFAVVGIGVNGFAAWRLHGSQSANAKVVGWHLLEDVLGWTAVLLVGFVALFVNLPILDPILSILITLYVLFNVVGTLKNVGELFLQAAPDEAKLDAVRARLEAIQDVRSTHHIHLWSLDGVHNVISAHIVVDAGTSKDDAIRIKCESREILADLDLHVEHVTLELEYADHDCSMHEVGG
jgi:cobalt-zinc-cadmium efflux system protein